jgi:hypothetical protein
MEKRNADVCFEESFQVSGFRVQEGEKRPFR